MKVTKWVDFGQDVDIYISIEDVRQAMCEAFANATRDDLPEHAPTPRDVCQAFDDMAKFLKSLTDGQIATLKPGQRRVITNFLSEQALRFKESEGNTP